jgi:RHS repeat-associated protein
VDTNTSNSGKVITFTYDALDRLTRGYTESQGGGTDSAKFDQSYVYNAVGNIISTTAQGVYGYPASGGSRPHAVITTSVGFSATYDANGNMLTRIEVLPGGRYTYTQAWDAENRLASVTQGGVTTTFTYNGDGQRVKVAVGIVVPAYVGNLYEVNPTTGVTTTYYYAGSQRIAMRTAQGVTYLAGDHLGSASLAMGASNTSQRYYPYGDTRSGGVPTDYQFTGQKNDTGTGLYYYLARYYDPVTGRFLSPDTVIPSPGNPQALNRYAYTFNNPLRYRDPSGHDPMSDALQFMAGLGYQWGRTNRGAIPIPMTDEQQRAMDALVVDTTPFQAGRVAGAAAAAVQGVAEMTLGVTTMGGGGLSLATVIGPATGASQAAVVAGAVVGVHGASVAGVGIADTAQLSGRLIAASRPGAPT